MRVFFEKKNPIVIFEAEAASFPLHLHNAVEFVMCLSGEILTTCDGVTKTLRAGDFFVALPNVVHSYKIIQTAVHILGIVNTEFVTILKPYFAQKTDDPFLTKAQTGEIAPLCRQLMDEINAGCSEEIIVGFLHLILGKAFAQLTFHEYEKKHHDVIPAILQYLEDSYTKPLTLEGIARTFGFSPPYLSKLFSTNIGIPLTRYINELRMNYAKHLLKEEEEHSMTQIAEQCGFATQRTFNRIFMEFEKISPRQYRKTAADNNWIQPPVVAQNLFGLV